MIATVSVGAIAIVVIIAVGVTRGGRKHDDASEKASPNEHGVQKAADQCSVEALKCEQYSTQGRAGRKLHELVFAAQQAGRSAEAICLARNNVNTTDGWLAGATHFETSHAWEALGCHELAVTEIEIALQRPRDRSWKDTCEWCAHVHGRCGACDAPQVNTSSSQSSDHASCAGVDAATANIKKAMLSLGQADGWNEPEIGQCVPINLPQSGWYVLGEMHRDAPDQYLTVHVAVDAMTAEVVAIGEGGFHKYNHICSIKFDNVTDGPIDTGQVVTMTEKCVDKMGSPFETLWVARVTPPKITVSGN
jgi:hypothetical protein